MIRPLSTFVAHQEPWVIGEAERSVAQCAEQRPGKAVGPGGREHELIRPDARAGEVRGQLLGLHPVEPEPVP
jgi:hypothetical protein